MADWGGFSVDDVLALLGDLLCKVLEWYIVAFKPLDFS